MELDDLIAALERYREVVVQMLESRDLYEHHERAFAAMRLSSQIKALREAVERDRKARAVVA